MERIEPEAFGLDCPSLADKFARCEPFERLQSAGEIVGHYEVGKVAFELLVSIIVVVFDGGVLECAVHPLDLTVRPRMFGLGRTMVDIPLGLGLGILEGVSTEQLAVRHGLLDERDGRPAGTQRCEVGSIIGQDDFDLVRNRLNEMVQEVGDRTSLGFAMKFDEGGYASPINCHEHVELAFDSLHLGKVYMEEADRIALELGLCCLLALDLGKTADRMAPKATMQCGAHQVRYRRLQRVEAVIERQQCMPSEGDDHCLLLDRQHCRRQANWDQSECR